MVTLYFNIITVSNFATTGQLTLIRALVDCLVRVRVGRII